MKFYIQKEIFLHALKKNRNVLSRNPIYPILENILININEKKLILITSNLEVEIQVLIEKKFFKIQESGSLTISGKKLFNICYTAPNNAILFFQLIKNKICIKINNNIYKLLVLQTKNFPKFNVYNFKLSFEIKENILKELILLTNFSIANNDIRNCLNGILLECKKNVLYGITTDGHRLSMYKKKINPTIPSFSIILSKKSILEIEDLLENSNEKIHITIYHNSLVFKKKNTTLKTKLIEDRYPNYSHIIIKDLKKCVTLPVENLKNSLKQAAILCDTTLQSVNLQLKKNNLIINTSNQEEEKSVNYINIIYNGENIQFSVNIFYLLDVLNAIKTTNIDLFFHIPIKKIQIQSTEKKNIYYVIMPLKL